MKKNDMNLLAVYQTELKIKSNHTSSNHIYLAILLATILIVGAYGLSLFIQNLNLKSDIKTLTEIVNSPDTVDKFAAVTNAQENLKRLDEIEYQVNILTDALDNVPRYNSKILNVIATFRPDSVHIDNLTFNLNYVMIDFHQHISATAANYVLSLMGSGEFIDVSYVGYTYDEVEKVYKGKIMCSLKGGQDNEAQ